mgnify:FL=1
MKQWSKPQLVQKPVSETLAGIGSNFDARNGETPIQS